MKGNYAVSLVFIGFFALLAFAVYLTESAWPLLGLFFTPEYKHKD